MRGPGCINTSRASRPPRNDVRILAALERAGRFRRTGRREAFRTGRTVAVSPEEILHNAVALSSTAERAAYVDGPCGTDAALRALLEGLLAAHEAAGGFLERPLFESATTAEATSPEAPAAVIGPYKLLQQIGEGGMGNVWMAEQLRPVQ